MEFRTFITESEAAEDIKETLKRLPKKHSSLIKGYKFKFEAGNTMKGDKEHVGLVNTGTNTITIAAPWSYGREWVVLHELAHMIWKKYIDEKLKKEWSKIVSSTKNRMDDNDEEIFCHAYSNRFAKNKIEIHNHPKWEEFIKKICSI